MSLISQPLDGSTTIGPTSKTLQFCAPEVDTEGARNKKSDIWSLGSVYLEILAVLKGRSREEIQKFFNEYGNEEVSYYMNPKVTKALLAKLNDPDSLDNPDNHAVDWITEMLGDEPKFRPDAKDLVKWTTRFPRNNMLRGMPCES
ncbi:hypothetical protein BJX63DRAFT_431630 [Aspergillus granulosus]|uniref:Protein kinase domain-containing protein n=1 Tax=Aspergillus granulosus TaxID=176169 RepID=A0ABR4HES7_9EURO